MTYNSTGNKTIHFEIKSQLAKLLATENITVQHNTSVSTAMFDVKSRVLTLPVWQEISEDLYDMLVVHEVGHALDTPTDGWKDAIDTIANKNHDNNPSEKAKSAVKDFLNVIEDARIDKRQKRRYPGSKRNYVNGYKELMNRNFFGTDGTEIASLPFIDRINLYFKTYGMNIEFNAEEKAFVYRIGNAETFDEVIQLTDEIYSYAKKKQEEQKSQTAQNDLEETEQGENDENGTESTPDKSDDNDSDLFDSQSTDSDDELDDDFNAFDGESEDGDEIDSDSDTDMGIEGDEPQDDVPQSLTERSAQKSLSTIVRNDDINYVYCHLPKIRTDLVVDDYPKFMSETAYYYNAHRYVPSNLASPQAFHEWKQKENDTISFMVKEFEMKKAADMHSRISIAKTGVLDTNKLHSYKYNEDIFRKLAVLPQGKNHGFVMLLDWSGSMRDNINHTMKQLISLTMFCKRVQIPFEVYLFRSASYNERVEMENKGGMYKKENGVVQFDEFKLRNILSSRMNVTTLNKAYEYLWAMSLSYQTGVDVMDSTPLNQAIVVLDEIINNFQKKNKLQIVNTIILTDGSSDPCGSVYFDDESRRKYYAEINKPDAKIKRDVYILRDEKTKQTYTCNMRYGDATPVLLKILKSRTNCNLIGFYLHNGGPKQLSHIADYNWLASPEVMKEWKENKFLTLTNQGYDEYYVLNVNKKFTYEMNTNNLNVDSNMTKARIAKEFIKYSEKKTLNRVLLTKFITKVSATPNYV